MPISPEWSGFQFFLDYGAPGPNSVNGKEPTFSGALNYSAKTWQLGVAHAFSRVNPGAFKDSKALLSYAKKGPGWGGFGGARHHSHTFVRGSLIGDKWLAAAMLGHSRVSGFDPALTPALISGTGKARSDFAQLEFTYKFNSFWAGSVSYEHYRVYTDRGTANARYNELVGGATYSLSKRTVLYALGGLKHAKGTNSYGSPAVAHLKGTAASTTSRQARLAFGVRHSF